MKEKLLNNLSLKTMKEKLLNNLSLKIMSIVIAFGIWLFVANENDPIITKLYNVKVSITNDSYLDELNKSYQIEDSGCSVVVYLKGQQSVVSGREDLVVEADLTQIVDWESDPTYVPVRLKPIDGIAMEDVTIMPQTIPVYIEDIAEKDFMITVNTTGQPASGYEIGECLATPEMVTIQGPDSIVNTIKSVVATVDVTGLTRSKNIKENLTIIDQNGNRLTQDAMSFLTIFNVGEKQEVNVFVELWTVVDDIKVVAEYTGQPAYGYQVDKIVTTPETISVAGSKKALQWLKEHNNTITIPAEMISIEGAKQDVQTNIKLSTILKAEDGFKIPSELSQSVYVRINILPKGSREYSIDSADIQIKGLSPNLRMSFIQSKVSVRVKSSNQWLTALAQDPSKISVSMDLTGYTVGQYTVPLKIVLPSECELVEEESIVVLLANMES